MRTVLILIDFLLAHLFVHQGPLCVLVVCSETDIDVYAADENSHEGGDSGSMLVLMRKVRLLQAKADIEATLAAPTEGQKDIRWHPLQSLLWRLKKGKVFWPPTKLRNRKKVQVNRCVKYT